MEVALCINTLLDTYQSTPAALRAKGSLCCTRIKHEPQPKIHIHYLGMHAFHLQCGGTGTASIFKPSPRLVCGVKTCFSSLRAWIWHVGSHLWTVSINRRLPLIWSMWRSQATAEGTEFGAPCVCRVSRRWMNCSDGEEKKGKKQSKYISVQTVGFLAHI